MRHQARQGALAQQVPLPKWAEACFVDPLTHPSALKLYKAALFYEESSRGGGGSVALPDIVRTTSAIFGPFWLNVCQFRFAREECASFVLPTGKMWDQHVATLVPHLLNGSACLIPVVR
jgi:hypothetical protein